MNIIYKKAQGAVIIIKYCSEDIHLSNILMISYRLLYSEVLV
jgi:hypothetical protein